MNTSKLAELHSLVVAAYDQYERGSTYPPVDHEVLTTLDGDGTPYGFVSRRENSLYVVFRGTVRRRWSMRLLWWILPIPTKVGPEWIRNAHFCPVDNESGKPHAIGILARMFAAVFCGRYHEISNEAPWSQYGKTTFGFRKHYQPLRAKLINCLSEYHKSVDHIFVCGHSLGGALATLSVPDLTSIHDTVKDKLSVATFASPRCVDREFADRLKADGVSFYRVANSEDVVPYLPTPSYTPSGPPDKNDVGYTHVGQPRCFTFHTGSLAGNHSMDTYKEGVRLLESYNATQAK